MSTNSPDFPRVERVVLHHGAKFDYEEARWTTPDGRQLARQFVRHGGSVVILPILDSPGQPPRVVLIRNRRMSVPADLWELPAGTLEKDEQPLLCAARELEEETGYAAGNIELLGRFHTSPGMTNELMHAFAARNLSVVGQRLEIDEGITVHPVPVAEFWAMVDRGEIIDAKTLAVAAMAARRSLL